MKKFLKTKITIYLFTIILTVAMVFCMSIKNKTHAEEELPKPELKISLDKNQIESGDYVVITVSMKYFTLTNLFKDYEITLYQNDSYLATVKMDETGTVTKKVQIKPMFATSVDIYASFAGNDRHQACQSNTVHCDLITKIGCNIELTMIKSPVNDDYNLIFTAKISSDDEHSFDGEYLDVYDGSESKLIESIKIENNGVAFEFQVKSTEVVYHNYFVMYHGNDTYRSAKSNNIEFGILSLSVGISNEEVTEDSIMPISVILTYGLNNVAQATVKLYMDGVYYQDVEINDGIGKVNYTVPHGYRGEHNIYATFEGAGGYIGTTSETVTYNVSTAKKPILVVEVGRNAFSVKETVTIVSKLVYENKGIEGAEIHFYLDDQILAIEQTNEDGFAQVQLVLTLEHLGKHKIKVEYLKNNDYAGATDETEEFEVYRKYYQISFDLNGVKAQEIDNQWVEDGYQVTYPTTPKHKIYSFKGWYKDKECEIKYDFDAVPTSDMTLYAKWSMMGFLAEVFIIVVLGALTIALCVIFIHKIRKKPTHYIRYKRKYQRKKL